MMKYWFWIFWLSMTLFMTCSCSSVKPYQKAKLNDAEMALAPRGIEKFQNNFLMYREGATGGNGGRTGGGCGCN